MKLVLEAIKSLFRKIEAQRTHWVDLPVEEAVVEKAQFDFTNEPLINSLNIEIVEGKTYKVTFDDVVYECVAYIAEGPNAPSIGNGEIAGASGGNGEPFFYTTFEGASLLFAEPGSHIISVSVITPGEVHRLDEKYLPDGVSAERIEEAQTTAYEALYSANDAMRAYNPHGAGHFTINSSLDKVGSNSVAIGNSTEASGSYSIAVCDHTVASGDSSAAMGYRTAASGGTSTAMGNRTTASGSCSTAMGSVTTASGMYSTAMGFGTDASSHCQVAQGKYNRWDIFDKYLHIIGNGTSDTARSNAHTLDWNGLGWFAGGLKIGGTSQDDTSAKEVALKEDIPDTSNLALKTEIPNVDSYITTHNTSTASHNDIRDLITGLTNRLNALADSDDTTLDQLSEIVNYIKSNKELIDAVTTSKVNISDIVDNLTTNVSNKPLSAAQGVALKALIDAIAVPTKVSELTNDSGYITGYTETDPTVPAWAKAASKPSYSKSEVGLGNVDNVKQYSASNPPPYPVTSVNGQTGAVTISVPTKVSQLQNDAGYIPASQGVSNAGKILMVDANGNLTLADVPDIGATGDIVGVVSENNEIILTGVLPEGSYTIKYEAEDGTTIDVGVINLESEQIIPLTLYSGKIDYNNNGAIVASDTYLYSDFIPVEKNKAYRFSIVGSGSVFSNKTVYYDANGNYLGISNVEYPKTSTATAGSWNIPVIKDAAQFRLRIYHSDTAAANTTKENFVLTKFTISYTNLLPTALDSNGSILNGVGYIQDKMLQSYPNGWRDASGYFSTGFFPYTLTQAESRTPVYVKGVTIDLSALDGNIQLQIAASATATEWTGISSITDMTNINQAVIVQLAEDYYMFIPNGNFYSLNGWNKLNPTVMRMSLPGTGEGVIITVGEPIRW